MKKFGTVLLLTNLIGLSALLIAHIITLSDFIALGTMWLLGSFVIILGPETITEITFWKASLKRDIKAVKQFRDEAEQIRDDLRKVTKVILEDAYILASNSFLAMGESEARKRLEANLDQLSKFAEPITEKREKWWAELHELFANRRQ